MNEVTASKDRGLTMIRSEFTAIDCKKEEPVILGERIKIKYFEGLDWAPVIQENDQAQSK